MKPATHLAIATGADFVKTSTGKTPVSATTEAAEIVLEAIDVSGRSVGSRRRAGSARSTTPGPTSASPTDHGSGWATPATFRFGASGVLDALKRSSPGMPTADRAATG